MAKYIKENHSRVTNRRVSKYKGVYWFPETQKWRSSVTFKGVKYECGYHDTERDAAKYRDMTIIKNKMGKPLQIMKPL